MRGLLTTVNPLVVLVIGFSALAGSFALRSLSVALLAFGLWLLAAVCVLPGWRYASLCLFFSALAALSVVYSTWRLGGHDERVAVTAGLRILVLAWPGSVAVGFLDTSRLGDHLAQTLRLPARFVAAFSAALQRFSSLDESWRQLARVRRARGFGPSRDPVASVSHAASMAFGLLVDALRGATQSAMAMDARGFATAQRRTWAEPARWSTRDVVVSIVALVLGLWPLVALVVERLQSN